ncbi:MAG: DUF108 domain-containing protein [Phycisphaerae bacterium]|nr:DUF108 domain-containing protein [Phycisphaerae bacterium]
MSAGTPARIGLVGMGGIGSYVYEQITTQPQLGLEIAFVSDISAERLKDLPPELVLDDPGQARERRPDLIVEMAHPDVTRQWGRAFLEYCDYMPLSLTALADAQLHEAMLNTAGTAGTCLYIPHGAAVGIDSIFECRDAWDEVVVTMKKNPRNMDLSAVMQRGHKAITAPTVLFEGPTREICPLFPRNVNSHAAVALAGIGFDRTRSRLIADPSLDVSIIEIVARGPAAELKIERSNPLKGVSGIYTYRAIWSCICRAKARGVRTQIC